MYSVKCDRFIRLIVGNSTEGGSIHCHNMLYSATIHILLHTVCRCKSHLNILGLLDNPSLGSSELLVRARDLKGYGGLLTIVGPYIVLEYEIYTIFKDICCAAACRSGACVFLCVSFLQFRQGRGKVDGVLVAGV